MSVRRRNLLIFVIVTLASGWLGSGLNVALGEPHAVESPGGLVWLVLPLLTAVILRLAGSGWKGAGLHPRVRRAAVWYLLALAIFPAMLVVLGAGAAVGAVDADALDGGALLPIVGSVFVGALVKNVFEEFVWRGFLTAELLRDGWGDLRLYLGVGLVWGLWHLPYYLVLLDAESMRQILDVPRGAFAAIAVVVMICWIPLFTEVYRLSGSIWPCVVLHAAEDATVNPILIEGFVEIAPGAAPILSPVVGLVPGVLLLAAGLALRSVRLRRERAGTTPGGDARRGRIEVVR